MKRSSPKVVLLVLLVTAAAAPARGDTIKVGGNVINETWTAAGSPYILQGDITVPVGSTLTIQAGTVIRAATAGDGQMAGIDPGRIELSVKGTMTVTGTTAMPVTFNEQAAGNNAWYGIVIDPLATSVTLDHVVFDRPFVAAVTNLSDGNVLTISDLTVIDPFFQGIRLLAGTTHLKNVTVVGSSNNARGNIYVGGSASATVTNCVIRAGIGSGIYFAVTSPNRRLDIMNCSIDNLVGPAVHTEGAGGTVTVTNSIVTNNNYGIYRHDSSDVTVSYSDVWNNTFGNYSGNPTQGAGIISQNPNYVAADDLQLQPSSVCIDVGTATGAPAFDILEISRPLDGDGIGGAGFDLGAYERAPEAICGNGAVEQGETCDSGADNGQYGACNATCTGPGPRCGDGMVNGPEPCDDGNTVQTDACLSTCVAAACGDGVVRDGVEACDDGNTAAADGCSPTCEDEDEVEPPADDGGCCSTGAGGRETAVLGVLGVLLGLRPRRRRR